MHSAESTIDDRIVVIRAGTGHSVQEFAVHEAILRAHSPFFRTALDKKWREGKQRHIDLPQDDVEVVAAYVNWLYFKKVASKPLAPPELPVDDGEYQYLARMYSFGDKVQADAFCDAVMDAMVAKTDDVARDGTRTFPSHSAIMTLYTGTPAESPARQFVVDMYLEFGAAKWISKEADCNHIEFLTDLTRAFMSRGEKVPLHKKENYPHRKKWHKIPEPDEFLKPAGSDESLRTLQ